METVATVDTHIEQLLEQMTLTEKIGQMAQAEKNSILPAEVTEYALGSVLSGGGGNPAVNTPANWREMAQGYLDAAQETRLAIPLIYGVDAVHGHNNLHTATIFPHNIGLGATRDASLVERIGRATALEMLACGVHWDFAPCLAVVQDVRWGRTYESYGSDSALVAELGAAYVRGLQSSGVAACLKHYVADGAAEWGTHKKVSWVHFWEDNGGEWNIDQGDVNVSEDELRRVHLAPYLAALKEGALTVMASFSSWRGLKMHAHRYLLTDVLKKELGFKGFIVSDWMGINQLSPDYYTCVVMGINAGLDMIMVPYNFREFIEVTQSAVLKGDIPMSRIDDAVRRILWVKKQLNLFEHPVPSESLLDGVGKSEHRLLAREAVRKSIVLLKNDSDTLPVPSTAQRIHLAGVGADDMGLQCGGWTVEWQGKVGKDTVPGVTLYEALRDTLAPSVTLDYQPTGQFESTQRAELGIVVVAETPYAEGTGDRSSLALSAEDVAVVERVRATCNRLVLVVYSGRPLDITSVASQCDAVVAAWLMGSEGEGLTDVLLGAHPFTGVASVAWAI